MISRLICWLIGHDSPTVGTPATDFTCKRCGWVPEYQPVLQIPANFEPPDGLDTFMAEHPFNSQPAWTKWRELGYDSPDAYFDALYKAGREE